VSPADPLVTSKTWGLPPDAAASDPITTTKAGALPGVDASTTPLARAASYEQRRPKQPQFQPFPTSTIGSFPQTAEVGVVGGALLLQRLQAAAAAARARGEVCSMLVRCLPLRVVWLGMDDRAFY
jgi:hypothetical protein